MTRSQLYRSLSWAPTISLSWMWGLGFFYSMHVVWTQGWLGFWVFALANAAGLASFGMVLNAGGRDPESLFARIGPRFVGLFLLCQFGAIAITLFSLGSYLWPFIFPGASQTVSLALSLLVTALACAIAHSATLGKLRFLHAGYLAISAIAIAVAWLLMPTGGQDGLAVPVAPAQSVWALLLPTLVGFALGPWADLQQWQRVIEIKRSGLSAGLAYAGGGLIFLALLVANAGLSRAAGASFMVAADGTLVTQTSVAARFGAESLGLGAAAFALWAAIAAVSTIDSFYCATRWYLSSLLAKSLHPALAFVPAAAAASPLWVLATAMAAAGVMTTMGFSQTTYMMPYATLLVGPTLCLVVWSVRRSAPFDTLSGYLWGLVAALVFFVGFRMDAPSLVASSTLIACLGAAPLLYGLLSGKGASLSSGMRTSATAPYPANDASLSGETREDTDRASVAGRPLPMASNDIWPQHVFDGQSFVMRVTPTYDDTNSVGNVYFANYVRWVGKARELFFNACMPKFDLETTPYFVLTKSFDHDFRREIAEFEPATVSIRIARHNRKFVTLGHEIRGANGDLIGRGEQDLMFVDRNTYKPLNIPADIVRGFLPFWPSNRPDQEPAEEREAVLKAG
ncbi:thioesterase family protein [Fulvimarina sp. MAC3]|uniref:acyl-CoA thioesterase n=1 Tax=Fulvimarina sp. MAC3 TaxID=3148887 RepID=UPI0031FC5B3A